MGYCISSEEGSIKIKKENMEQVLKVLSDFFQNEGSLRWVNGFNIADMYAVEDDEDTPLELGDIWDDLRYSCIEDGGYYIITEFLGEKYGDDDKLFTLIAPYCEDGYLQFSGEDGECFRFVINNGKFKEVYATKVWNY